MPKQLLCFALCILHFPAFAQNDFFLFKKKNKTLSVFTKSMYIAFQTKDLQWNTGHITSIRNDTFTIKPMAVFYGTIGTDTVYYDEKTFTLSEVYAMPKPGIQIDFINSKFQITTSGGHVHWYWVKSGWIFRVAAAGYASLKLINGYFKNDFSIANEKNELLTAGGVFLFGVILKLLYKPTLRIGKKYHMVSSAQPIVAN
jgi:hypothetical protein